MNKRLTIITLLQQGIEIVELLIAKENELDFKSELSNLKKLMSEAIDLLNSDDTNEDFDYSKITDLIDWALRIFAVKEIWNTLQ